MAITVRLLLGILELVANAIRAVAALIDGRRTPPPPPAPKGTT